MINTKSDIGLIELEKILKYVKQYLHVSQLVHVCTLQKGHSTSFEQTLLHSIKFSRNSSKMSENFGQMNQ
jgi:hypothetical protein